MVAISRRTIGYLAGGFLFVLLGGLLWVRLLAPGKATLSTLVDPVYLLIALVLFGFVLFGYVIGQKAKLGD